MTSAAVRHRIAGVAITSTVALGACGQGGEGDSFSAGRACRNVERLIEAVQANDLRMADQELDRLTDDGDVEQRIDVAELNDVVDDPGADAGDAIEDAVSGLDCDVEIQDVVTDPTTTPTESTVTDPTTAPTESTVTDPTTGPTGEPPFTLPPAPTTGTVPATDPTATTSPSSYPRGRRDDRGG
ncbi:MAG: hypothetical protein ACR2HP_02870 [Ilumatobacteraceae bacterium]